MHREGAFLTASPNPVPIGGTGGLRGTTTICWSTGDGSEGQVYLAVRGQPEHLFVQGSRGFQEAPWISPSATFEFRLYAGTEHKVLLASVKVVARDLQTELFRGLLRNCYEYYGNTIDFWTFPSSRINRSKVWIRDRLLLFAKRIGFVPRDKGIEGTLERLTWVLGNLERLDNFYRLLRDDYSKQLLVDLLKFRVLREKRVKLPLNNSEYWSKRKSVDKNFLKTEDPHGPLELASKPLPVTRALRNPQSTR